MEKKESLNKEFPDIAGDFAPQKSGLSGKVSGFYHKAFGIVKFILGICLLPFVYAVSAALLNEFNLIDKSLQNDFWSGVIAFLLIYLFVWEPALIYAKGQKLLELIFRFFKPLVRVAPYLLPVYTIILFVLYWVSSGVSKSGGLVAYFIFLFGFSIGLHLVFSAKSIRSKKGDFLKGNYIFGFSFVYIINLWLLAFCFSLIFDKFSFVNFSNNSFQEAKDVFSAVFKQLFL